MLNLKLLRNIALALVLGLSTAYAGNYHELTRFPLGGDGGWDYLVVDAPTRRLFIARSNRIMVVDVDTGKPIGEITGLERAHGVALVNSLNRGFASSGGTGEVVAFDLKTLKILGKIKAGENPDAILFDQASKRLFAFNGKSSNITAIDPESLKVLGTVPVSGKPEFAVSDEAGHVFFNIEDKNELDVLDPAQLKITAQYPLAPCEEPTGVSLDRVSKRLIVGCGNRVAAIVAADTGKISQTFKVGDGVDATAYDTDRKLAFVSAGEGVLTILASSAKGFKSIQDLKTVKGARTLAVDEKTGRIFLPVAKLVKDKPDSRPSVVPGTFEVLVVGK